MAINKRLRYEILRRDGYACRYCGASAPDAKLVIDHVTPTALGGTDTPDNLVTACDPCNSGKSSASPDSTVVSDVADDALRWSAAIKQAAAEMEQEEGPKLAYRQSFLDAWNEWTYQHNGKTETFDLPEDWRSSIERYRLAGIPAASWPDLIEPGMVNKKVRSGDVFRYTCGVANKRLDQLAGRARQLIGASSARPEAANRTDRAVREAAMLIWSDGMDDGAGAPTADQVEAFSRSLEGLTTLDALDPHRIIEAAQHATYFGISSITEALRDLDRDSIWRAWITAWPTTYVPGNPDDPFGGQFVGGAPEEYKAAVREQIEKLLDGDAPLYRTIQAATYAGFHKSARLYRGLTAQELEASGTSPYFSRTVELWRVAFTAGGDREPSEAETRRLFDSLRSVTSELADSETPFWVDDLHEAAAWAGAYQDPNVLTCLPLCGSVFTAAAMLRVTRDVTASVTRDIACDTPVTSQNAPSN